MLENTLTAALVRLLPEGGGHPLSPITRAEIHDDAIDMLLPVGHLRRIRARLRTGETADVDPEDRTLLRLSLPVRLKERGYRPVIVAGTEEQHRRPDPTLVRALRNAHAMLSANRSGNPQLAEAPTTSYRRRLIRLAFLAPDLQRAILEGRQPFGLTMAALMEGEFPLSWATQRKKFGTPHPE